MKVRVILQLNSIIFNLSMMSQSQKILHLQKILSQSQPLKNMLNLIRSISSKYDNCSVQAMANSQHYKFLVDQMKKLEIVGINTAIDQLKQPDAIIALPIKMQPNFTLFFVLVPKGKKFDWHSHPKMNGISKCIHGQMDILTLDFHQLINQGDKIYIYPKSHLRFQKLGFNCNQTVSTIVPNSLNVHKIVANTFSAFFDLLMPDYPENKCDFFTTYGENQTHKFLQLLENPLEDIKGWDVYYNELVQAEKHIVKNYILK